MLFRTGLPWIAVLALSLAGCSRTGSEVKTYQLGEKAGVGPLVYTVFEGRWATHMGDDPASSRIPSNRFFLVRLAVRNNGGSDAIVPAISIQDDAGQSTGELVEGGQVPNWIGAVRRLKPGETLEGNVVFDAAPKKYRLRVADEADDNSAFFEIPLEMNETAPHVGSSVEGAVGQPQGANPGAK